MIGVALSTILTIVIATLGVVSLQSTTAATQQLAERDTQAVGLAGEIRTDQQRIEQLWLFTVIENDRGDFEAMLTEISDIRSKVDQRLSKLRTLVPDQQAGQFDKLNAAIAEYRQQTAKIPALWRQGRKGDAEDVLQHDAKAPFAQVDTTASEISAEIRGRAAADAKRLDEKAASTIRSMIVMSVIGLIAIVALVLALVRYQVTGPIAEVTDRMRRLADGDTDIEIRNDARRDEIGEMARAVIVFRDNARRQKADDAAKQKAEAQQREVVDALSHSLSGLSQGDLTVDIVPEFPPAYAEVRSNFNQAVASLRTLIGTVMQSTASIDTGAHEIAAASEDLARRTESNAASLEQTSAAVTQMNDRLRTTAAAAQRTVHRADGAIATVTNGRGVADGATRAMSRVSDSAKGIDDVIEGLDKIAFQTRVLAMNAAVEAGRAGEAGRGFAVVADLVSALAMRAEEEAGRAREQLTVTQEEIISAVDMVEKVDGALADILKDVNEVHSLVGDIAGDNQAQSNAITEISAAIGTMDHATQQNAAMVEQTSAAARNLTGEVSNLARQAGQFHTGEAQMRSTSGQGDTGRQKPAPRPSPPAQKIKAKTPVNGSNGYKSPVKALPGAVPADAGDDWASF
ncbi:MCP four helix bundle domain-containing protein [Stakelama sp. CBK3Z-3]|uniref:MCP four helix bundle domain-containing protein n=2 Tax=Stakelama flava TaxID=2860338 RepID=A0ABS6XIF6_9SPHN|nr:MCP four helix bundle domain-containing protein [Stakelama flava]